MWREDTKDLKDRKRDSAGRENKQTNIKSGRG